MNGIQWGKPPGHRCNLLLDAVVTIFKYKKIIIDHDIYINVFSDIKVYYFTVYTDSIFNTTNNEKNYHESTRFFEEAFDIK